MYRQARFGQKSVYELTGESDFCFLSSDPIDDLVPEGMAPADEAWIGRRMADAVGLYHETELPLDAIAPAETLIRKPDPGKTGMLAALWS